MNRFKEKDSKSIDEKEGGQVCLSPAQVVAAVVESLPRLAEAHVDPKGLWVVAVKGPHQAG